MECLALSATEQAWTMTQAKWRRNEDLDKMERISIGLADELDIKG